MTADHAVRPIIVPRDVSALPWNAGYAETINGGKSRHNEDQAMARQGSIGVLVVGRLHQIHYTVFAVFDGHAGAGCAVTASNDLWAAVQARLESVATQLVGEEGGTKWFTRTISKVHSDSHRSFGLPFFLVYQCTYCLIIVSFSVISCC